MAEAQTLAREARDEPRFKAAVVETAAVGAVGVGTVGAAMGAVWGAADERAT